MTSTGTENYSRIMLTLMRGGTKLTRRLVEKRVKDLSKNGGEDTIDEFLLKNKSLILKQKLGKHKQDVFFPLSGQTNLDYWDLCMFCLILEETCDLTHITKMYIKKLLKIRNKFCHLNDPTLETRKFDEYTEQIKCSFEYCLKEINDDKFTEEMNALVQSLAYDPLSIDDTLKAVHKLYHLEWTQREFLEKIGNGQALTHGKLDILLEKVERLDSRRPSGASVDIPGFGLVIEVKNCSAEKKKEVLDILEKNFNEAIEQKVSSLEEDLPNGVLHTLREAVTQVFREFLIMGRHIIIVEQKCLMLTIKCTSVKSFVKMVRDYRTGDLSLQLSTIETAIKNLQECGNVQLENLIFKEEFMEVMDDLVSKLYERVQHAEYTAVQRSSNADNSIRVTFKNPTISDREAVQNRFETKKFTDGMKRIETELRRKLNVKSMSLTTKLVKDDAVSNFEQQSDKSVVDKNATVEEETENRQSRRKAALFEEEDISTPSRRTISHLIPDKSTHFFKGPARGQETQISFDDNKMDMQKRKLWTKIEEEETENRQSRRKAAFFEEEDISTPSLRRKTPLISDKSTHFFKGPVVKARGKETQISFYDNKMDMRIGQKTRYLTDKLQELLRNIKDPSQKTEINKLNQETDGLCECVVITFTVTGRNVLLEKEMLSRVFCLDSTRVDAERLSQTLLALKGDLSTCRNKLVSMVSSIHSFIRVIRCTIIVEEGEIKRIKAMIGEDMLETKIRIIEKEISKHMIEATTKQRDAVVLEERARYLRRKSEEHKEKGMLWGFASAVVGIVSSLFIFGATVETNLISAGIGMAVNLDDANDCERVAASLRVSAQGKEKLARRKQISIAEYRLKWHTKYMKLQNSKAKIDHLANKIDGLASLESLLTECILGFERAILIAQDFENAVHQTVLQGDSFQSLKEVFQEYPEEHHDETHEQMNELKRKWVQLERMLLVNSDRYGIMF